MIPEIGHFCLILALCLSVAQAFFGLAGPLTGRHSWTAIAKPTATGQFVFVAIAFGFLVHAFVVNDFSVAYVANNSNTELPLIYRISAVWGAHEGSLLLWTLMLSIWTVAVAFFSRRLPENLANMVLGVLGLVTIGFLWFTLATSNPFDRLIPAALEGRDLNPLLQDPALAIHPPMLYMGYVGFSVAFAFAVAAMLEGRLDSKWARWTRPWTTAAWIFLTIGITLGSWWAYYELGWGGWWFWDPVENASFMPWLVGTALMHSLAVTEKRGLFRSWTLLLAVAAFSLSLLGTFLVRSGVLVSVHAFATDPARGVFILMLLAFFIGGSLILYAWRAPAMAQSGGFHTVSRESFLLINNMLLVSSALLILLGTLYPLFLDALGLGKISVGPPYFSTVFLIPTLPMIMMMAIGMHAAWKKSSASDLLHKLRLPAVIALVLALVVPFAVYGGNGVVLTAGLFAGIWLVASSLYEPVRWLVRRRSLRGYPRSMLGMSVAHFGVAVFAIGVGITSAFSIERDISMLPGETSEIAGYEFEFRGTRNVEGPNYSAVEGEVAISRDGDEIAVLSPQKRVYRVQRSPMTESGIQPRLTRDLYVALGEPLGGEAWSLRMQYKPLIRLVWLGALLMAFGGMIAMSDRRYRAREQAEDRVRTGAEAAT
ncbi:MAG: heme lyase CcmF/NrfE family subunit [Gammaproteobacteria bacterium]|nr:MAG: heme lyase CcmF/NrfE family subunit [Gammaproteobacteria bacterium]